MIRFYQTEWFGIPFDSFASLSFFSLADKAFYEKFYDAFFDKFSGYDALPEPWRAIKRQCAQAIAAHIPPVAAPKILSVGCGSGFVEHCLLQMHPDIQLHCTDTSKKPFRWLAHHCRKSSCISALYRSVCRKGQHLMSYTATPWNTVFRTTC